MRGGRKRHYTVFYSQYPRPNVPSETVNLYVVRKKICCRSWAAEITTESYVSVVTFKYKSNHMTDYGRYFIFLNINLCSYGLYMTL